MSVKRIIIVNDGLDPNMGDQAILRSMLALIQSELPEVRIRIFPNSGMRSLRQYAKYRRALRQADLLVFGGGQEIQDHASVAFLISGLIKIALAGMAQVPVFCYAIGVGPLRSRLGRRLTAFVLNRVKALSVRDDISRKILLGIGVTRPAIEVTADPAVTLQPKSPHPATPVEGPVPTWVGPHIVIAPRRWFHYGHYLLPMEFRAKLLSPAGQAAFDRLMGELARAADALVRRLDAHISFCPMRCAHGRHNPGQDDDQVCLDIMSMMAEKAHAGMLPGATSPNALKWQLGNVDLVIGMRMHALILASMMGVPVVSIGILPKHEAFMRQIDQASFTIAPERLMSKTVVALATEALRRHAEIGIRLKEARGRLQALARSDVNRLGSLLR